MPTKAPATPRFESVIYEQFARVTKALASPRRLELLDLLAQGPRTVDALARETGLSIANASQHLKVLRAARLAEADKQGLFVTYRLAGSEVGDLCRAVRRIAEQRLAEVEQVKHAYLNARDLLEPVDRAQLTRRIRRGAVTLIDVRPAEEYQAGHLSGALSVPLAALRQRLNALPRSREIVAYCRGPYCVLAVQAVELLRSHGLRAVRLEDGVAEWRARGLPVTTGDRP
jgi:rhodanese-related sulfurtransferase/DNA-binding transcriptional ArsR family regulator